MPSLLEAVADWNVEARGDRDPNLFVPFSTHERVLDGRRSFVVGRKGVGKTALAQHISRNKNATVLNFDLFHFKNLESYADGQFNARHDFINIWTYIIYMSSLEVLHNLRVLDYDTKQKLNALFGGEKLDLNAKVSRWAGFSAGISFLGFEIKGSGNKVDNTTQPDLRGTIRAIENFMKAIELTDPIYVILDDLDENLDARSTNRDLHLNMVVSLLKSVLRLRTGELHEKIRPIVCIRDDMYYSLKDNDRAKWTDVKFTPEWSDMNIRKLLNHRFCVSIGSEDGFESNWTKIFLGRAKNGSGQYETFEIIKNYTQNKPRDYIAYLQMAARFAIGNNMKGISIDSLKHVLGEFSDHMFQECRSEVAMVLDNADYVFGLLRRIRKPAFPMDDFVRMYDPSSTSLENYKDAMEVLRILYRYSIIGSGLANGVTKFNYQQVGDSFDEFASAAVHRSLHRKLNLY